MKKKGYNVFAILAIIFAFVFFPLGLIFGIISLVQIKKTGEEGKGLAIASIVIGGIFLLMMGAWFLVVRPAFDGGGGYIEGSAKCIVVDVEATAVSCSNVGVNKICDVTFERTGTGTEAIGGLILIFKDTNVVPKKDSSLITVSGNIEPSTSVTKTGINTTLSNVDTVEAVVFFKDESGNDNICPYTSPFKFA